MGGEMNNSKELHEAALFFHMMIFNLSLFVLFIKKDLMVPRLLVIFISVWCFLWGFREIFILKTIFR